MMQEESLNETTKLQELGTALRQRREHKGLKIEDIALRIKVSSKNLHAIEAGSQAGLPQAVFTRGFIRSYAQVLKMDLDVVEPLLKEAFPENLVNNINAERTTDAREQSVGINSPVVPKKFFAGLGLLILFGAIAAGVWLYLGSLDKLNDTGTHTGSTGEASQRLQESADNDTPSVPGMVDGEDRPREEAGPAASALPPLAENSAVTQAPAAEPQPPALAANPPTAPTGEQFGDRIAVNSTVVRTSSNPPSGVHQVQISVVSGHSWIGIQADSNTSRNFELRTGRSYLLKFREKATLTIGNAAGVQVTYNGQRVPFTARDGEVKILRFQPAG